MFGMWSPDGQTIAFTSDRSGDPEIYVAKADGSGLQRLTMTAGRDAHPSWTPDGRQIVFQSPRENGQVRLFIMNADGSNQRPLTRNQGFCGVPFVSPDGLQVAYQCAASLENLGSDEVPWRLWLVSVESGDARVATHGPGNDQVPYWSRDGRKLLFFSDRSGSNQLYELTVRSGRIRRITSGPNVHGAASYAHRGKRMAVMRTPPGGNGDIHVIDRRGRSVRITSIGPEFGAAYFSPDDTMLLFQMPTAGGVRLFTAPSDGSDAPRVIEFRP